MNWAEKILKSSTIYYVTHIRFHRKLTKNKGLTEIIVTQSKNLYSLPHTLLYMCVFVMFETYIGCWYIYLYNISPTHIRSWIYISDIWYIYISIYLKSEIYIQPLIHSWTYDTYIWSLKYTPNLWYIRLTYDIYIYIYIYMKSEIHIQPLIYSFDIW